MRNRKFYQFGAMALIMLFCIAAYQLQAQGPIITETFEDYTAGEHLAAQAPDYWTTWSNNPGSAEDPMVTADQAFEGNNSIVIEGTNDAVLLLGDKINGRYALDLKVFIPTGYLGYFNVLHKFNGSNSEWGTQMYFDQSGSGSIDAGAEGAATFSFDYDTWIPVHMVIDINNDWAEVYVNEEMLVEWQWSLGTFGTPGLNQLGAMNFYAWTGDADGTPKFYIDNLLYEELEAPLPATNLQAVVNGRDVTLSWDAPVGMTPLGYNIFMDDNKVNDEVVTEISYLDENVYPGTHNYTVKAVYDQGQSPATDPVEVFIEGGEDRQFTVVEIATGTWCGYCPGAAMGADELHANGHNVAIIEYHSGDNYENAASGYRANTYYSVSGYPTAYFDGGYQVVGGSATNSMYETYLPKVENRLDTKSVYGLDMQVSAATDDDFNVSITASKLEEYAGPDVTLHLVLTESHIPENWQGQTELNFVCREMYPDQWGTLVDFSAGAATYDFSVSVPYDLNNCELIAFLQDEATKEVLQADLMPLYMVGVCELTTSDIQLFPNPASDYLRIQSVDRISLVEIYDRQGRMLAQYTPGTMESKLELSGLQSGIYMVRVETEANAVVRKLYVK